MSTNIDYFRPFKWVLGATLIHFIVISLLNYYKLQHEIDYQNVAFDTFILIQFMAPALLTSIAIWVSIGLAFNYKKEALIALGLTVAGMLLNISITSNPAQVSPGLLLSRLVIGLIPYLVFGFLVFKDKRAWLLGLVYFVSTGLSAANFGVHQNFILEELLESIDMDRFFYISKKLSSGGTRSFNLLDKLVQSLSLPVLYLVFSQILLAAKNNCGFFSGKTIDLSTTRSKGIATIVFCIFSMTIFHMGIGAGYFVSASFNDASMLLRKTFFAISFLISIYLVAVTYRNFMTEYLISRNSPPGWLYFWWNIPLVNILAWIISLFTLPKPVSLAARIDTFEKGQKKKQPGHQITNHCTHLHLVFVSTQPGWISH